jgi:hypothetical protein
MPRHRLVHRVVDDLGRQVMQSRLVGAADIHARTAPDRLQPLENLDVLRRVGGLVAALFTGLEQIVVHGVFLIYNRKIAASPATGQARA